MLVDIHLFLSKVIHYTAYYTDDSKTSTASRGHPRCMWQSDSPVGGEQCQLQLSRGPVGAKKHTFSV